MDIGAGFELRTNKLSAMITLVGSVALTALLWAWIIELR
jgi:succinate dehydrogenase / fumarate reductase cytochrome b subunit